MERVDHVFEHPQVNAWVDTDPENLSHDEVGVLEGPDHAMRNALVGGLPQQVSCEQKTGGDLSAFKKCDHLITVERRILADGDGKTKPARVRIRSCLGQDEEIFQVLQPGMKRGEIGLAPLNK